MDQINRLISYERSGIKFSYSPRKNLELAKQNKKSVEHKCIGRAYADLQTSLLSLKTESGKRNRVAKFFEKMDYYSSRMESSNIAYLSQLKEEMVSRLKQAEAASDKFPLTSNSVRFCSQCGNQLSSVDLFCSKCGFKVQ